MVSELLDIKNLQAGIPGKSILKGINLTIRPGEVHAIMGPNGSGKSTLASVLAGCDDYEVTGGEAIYRDRDLLSLSARERACQGIFLAFQYPVEIPGVSNVQFLKTALNSIRKYHQQDELDAMEFLVHIQARGEQVGMDEALLYRAVNQGFSGGEKKRNEILQMLVLEPSLAILDETDSGLDIDALKVVARGVNAFRGGERGIILVTHYQRLLNYIKPDFVHILLDGCIVESGGPGLALELEEKGYGDWTGQAGPSVPEADKGGHDGSH